MARELDLGGSERQLALLARTLDRSRFEPIVGCFRADGLRGRELQAAGVEIAQFPVRSFRSPLAIPGAGKLAWFIHLRGIRLVHTFDYPTTVFALPIAKVLTRAAALSSQRSHRDLIPPSYRSLVRMTDRLASAVVVNSEFVRLHLEQDEKIPAPRIRMCYNGIDLNEFSPGDGPKPVPFAPGTLVVGVVCVLRPEKSLSDLLEAFARARGASTPMKLVIVGSGPEGQRLEALARSLAIADDCIFAPATDKVAPWLRAIDIFVLPSRTEALSNSLMEAMACGCCAIGSNVGGNGELIRNGETGLLYKAGDIAGLAAFIRLLIENVPLRRRLATAGMQSIRENFSIRASAQRMGEIYTEFIERPPRT